jgi:hypothetical protein
MQEHLKPFLLPFVLGAEHILRFQKVYCLRLRKYMSHKTRHDAALIFLDETDLLTASQQTMATYCTVGVSDLPTQQK